MKLSINMKSNDDAFADENAGNETARILRKLADLIEEGELNRGKVFDVNGNHCGSWRYQS